MNANYKSMSQTRKTIIMLKKNHTLASLSLITSSCSFFIC